jgi:hypothetical protein
MGLLLDQFDIAVGEQALHLGCGSVAASKQAEAAKNAGGGKNRERIEPCPKHEGSRSNRNGNGPASGISRTCHHGAAADDEAYGNGNQPEAHDVLPWGGAEPIPQAEGSKIYGAGRPEGRKCARHGSGNSPHLPPDKAHHQDHVRPRDGLRQRKKLAKSWFVIQP